MFLKSILSLIAPMAFLRLYGGGGGDGGAGQMRADEMERQQRVQAAVDTINSRFGQRQRLFDENAYLAANPDVAAAVRAGKVASGRDHYEQWGRAEGRSAGGKFDPAAEAARTARDSMYAQIADAVRDTAMRDVDRQFTTASQRNKFGLARSGLLGGSVDVESGGQLATLYGEGKLKASQAGQQAAADLRSTDERTRQNLISLAQSGLDTGTAASMASAQMASAADAARGAAGGASVGRLFDDLSQAYVTNQVMRARYPNGPQQMASGYSTGVFAPSRYTGTEQR
jgi:hypothetical protein